MINPNISALEDQVRQSFGRVVYTHKVHEKCADNLLSTVGWLKNFQIIISTLVTLGTLPPAFGLDFKFFESLKFKIFIALLSAVLLAINFYLKERNHEESARRHQQTATDFWLIREKYISLLTDIRANVVSLEVARDRRDRLLDDSYLIIKSSPRTNSKAYQQARKGLKENEEMTFSDREIDAFLPKELRKLKL